MKYLLLTLLSLLIGCTQYRTTSPATPSDLDAVTLELVEPDEDGKPHVYCSAVWVSDSRIVTAAHCVEDKPTVAYTTVDASGTPRLGLVISVDEDNDVAMIHAVDAPKHKVAPLYFGPITRGLPVQTMGHPMGREYSYSKGYISGEGYRNVHGMHVIQSTAPVGPGNSGGGLFTMNGELVGVCSMANRHAQNMNLYIPAQYVGALLGRPLL